MHKVHFAVKKKILSTSCVNMSDMFLAILYFASELNLPWSNAYYTELLSRHFSLLNVRYIKVLRLTHLVVTPYCSHGLR